MSRHTLKLTAAEAGQRLDRYLRKLLTTVPLGAIMKHLRSGRIRIDGGKAKPSLRIEDGMELGLDLPAPDLEALGTASPRQAPAVDLPADAPLPRIVYADDDVLVIHKPSGLAVHAGSGNEDHSVVAWLDRDGRGVRTATFAPAPAHRLDRGTSGLVAIGLSPAGLGGLTAAFREDAVRKVYAAVVEGVPSPARGTIDAPLLVVEAASSRAPKVRVDAGGKSATTDYEVLDRSEARALVRLVPGTGRTHQLRVHLAHIGHPIVGDRRYGDGGGRGGRLMLHAAELEFPHPVTRERLACSDPLPADFPAALRGSRSRGPSRR